MEDPYCFSMHKQRGGIRCAVHRLLDHALYPACKDAAPIRRVRLQHLGIPLLFKEIKIAQLGARKTRSKVPQPIQHRQSSFPPRWPSSVCGTLAQCLGGKILYRVPRFQERLHVVDILFHFLQF